MGQEAVWVRKWQPCVVGCAQRLLALLLWLTPPWQCSAPSLALFSSLGWAPTLLLPTAPQVSGHMGPGRGLEAVVATWVVGLGDVGPW